MADRWRRLAVACVVAALMAASPLLAKEPKAAPEPEQPGLVVTRALTEGTVQGNLARLTVVLEVESHQAGEQRLSLFAATTAVTDWSVSSGWFGPDAYVRRTTKGLELVVQGEGKCKLTLEVVAQVRKERLVNKLTVPVVSGLVTKATLEVPGKDLEVKLQPELGMETKASGEKTTITVYGGEGDVDVSWTPKAPEKELKPVAFADQTTLLRISQGVMRITSVIDYTIVQGSLGEFQVSFPKDLNLLNIEGSEIRTWDLEETEGGERKTLKVVLLGAVEKQYKLSLNLEKVLPQLEMDVEAPSIEPQGLMREKGQIAVSAAKGIRVEAGKLENISHVDVREMAGLPVAVGDEVRLGFRYLKRPFTLTLRTGDVIAKTSVEVLTLVRASMDSMRLSTTLNYSIRDAGVFQFQVNLDKGLKLVDINGQNINNWQLDEAGLVLTVALRSKAEGDYSLQVETETAVASPDKAPIPVIHAAGVDKEVGYVAVLPAPGMKVETAELAGVSQIDVKELPETLGKQSPALAYRYIRPDYQVMVNVSLIEPEVEAEVQTVAVLDERELSMDTEIHYSIRRAGIFQLRVSIPKELRRTVDGADIDDTSYDESKGMLTVNLRSKVMDKYVLKVTTAKTLEDIEKGVELPVISTVDVKKESGFLSVVTKASVRLKPDKEGLSDIGVNDLPPEMYRRMTETLRLQTEGSLAYKYFAQPWQLALTAERIQPQVQAEVFNLLSIGEKLVSVSATVSYTIREAGVDTFVVKLPPGATEAKVSGASVKHQAEDKDNSTWTITTQSKCMGTYNLYVNFQQKVAEDQKLIPYTGVEAVGVQRETGYLAITSRPDIELRVGETKTDIEGLTPIDGREIPQTYMRGVGLPVLLAYRYAAPPYCINMAALPHDAAEVTVAVVESARLSTTVTEEGDMLTDLVCVLRNTRQQYLDLKLPKEKTQIWHAFVVRRDDRNREFIEAVTPMRPSADLTKIPVAQSAAQQQRPLEVRLRYSEKAGKLGRVGTIELRSPFVGIDVMRLGWTLSLPEGYDIVRDTGSIRRLEWPYMMEQQLQQLQPDTEVRVQVQERAELAKQVEDQQAWHNVQALDMNESTGQGKGGQSASVYTGYKPLGGRAFEFQSLIVSKDEPATVEVTYVKGSLGIPLKGVVAIVVAVLCGLLWRAVRWRPLSKIAVILVATVAVLGVRTLAESAFRDYLTVIVYALLAMAGLLLLWTIIEWVRGMTARKRERNAAWSRRRTPPGAPPAPPQAPSPQPEPKPKLTPEETEGSSEEKP